MLFHYIASDANGKITEGNKDVENSAEILGYLSTKGLKPISLKIVKGIEEGGKGRFMGQAIATSDKIFLTKYLAMMLKVGTDLFRAIDILIKDTEKPAIRIFLAEVRSALEKGLPFYSVFVKYPKYFSTVFVSLVKAGEASGNLENIFEELSVSLQKEQEIRNKVKSAVMYPVILLGVSFAVLFLLVSVVLPKIASVFEGGGIKPPAFSRIVFSVGLFISSYMWFFVFLIIFAVFASWFLFAKTIVGKRIVYRLVARVPIIGRVLKKIALQRFASTLSILLKSGLRILDSLEITAEAVGHEELRLSLLRISREKVARGMTIADAFRSEAAFPHMVSDLIAISEKTGYLSKMLDTLSTFYESEIETSIKNLVSFLEPMLILIIGVIVALIAFSVIVPIYQMVGQFVV